MTVLSRPDAATVAQDPELHHRVEALQAALREAPLCVYLLDGHGRILHVEGPVLLPGALAPGSSLADGLEGHPWAREALLGALAGSRSEGHGEIGGRTLRLIAAPSPDAGTTDRRVTLVVMDATELHRTEEALRDDERRLRLLLERTPGILWTTDRNLVITSNLGAGLAHVGQTPGQNVGASFAEVVGSSDPDFAPIRASTRALQGTPTSYDLDWGGRCYTVRIEPFLDEDGSVAGTIGLALDITERRIAEAERDRVLAEERAARRVAEDLTRKSGFLSDASRVMASSFDYRAICSELARLAVPYLADICVFHLVWEDGATHRETIAHGPPEHAELLRRLEQFPLDAAAPKGLPWVMRTGQSIINNDAREKLRHVGDSSWPFVGSRDPAYIAALLDLGLRSYMAVPLPGRAQLLGAITFADTSGARHYGPRELDLAEDVARRCAMAIDNALLYQEAREAVAEREEFLSIASHELRTPVTSLQLSVQNLIDLSKAGTLDRDDVRESLAVAERQTRRLGRLVTSLLDVTRIQAGRLDLALGNPDLAEIAREVAAAFEQEARLAGVTISVTAPHAVHGKWDGARIEQAVTNLVSNAIKYGAGHPVSVRVGTAGKRGRIEVQDHGIGVPADRQEQIFERFERAAPTEAFAGLGLGLYITRCIVEAHQGTVHVRSQPGQGATFVVNLPLAGPGATPAHAEATAPTDG